MSDFVTRAMKTKEEAVEVATKRATELGRPMVAYQYESGWWQYGSESWYAGMKPCPNAVVCQPATNQVIANQAHTVRDLDTLRQSVRVEPQDCVGC